MHEAYKTYKKDLPYTYALGGFPVFELLNKVPERVREVLVHPGFNDYEKLTALCQRLDIPCREAEKQLARLSPREDCFAAAVFYKQTRRLNASAPHVLMHNPGNMGNLGTIMRTALGFGMHDMGIVLPGADCFDPKCVRASMGAMFHLNIQLFNSIEEYIAAYPQHTLYLFMLREARPLPEVLAESGPVDRNYTLVFGNEGSGLPDGFSQLGVPVFIPQSAEVDSLNVTVAAAVGLYAFYSYEL